MSDKPKSSAWGIGAFAIYGGFVIFILALVLYASIQDVQLVEESYYEKGLAHQDRIDRRDRAAALEGTLRIEQDIRQEQVLLILPAADSAGEPTGTVRLVRPSNSRLDRTMPLQIGADNTHRIATGGLTPGLWLIEIDWIMDSDKYYTEARIVIP